MIVTINGKEEIFSEPLTIFDLLKLKDVNPDGVVIELNLSIVEKETYAAIQLQDKDVVEILRFVGGGITWKIHS